MNKMFDTQMRHAPILLALNIIEPVAYKIFNKHPKQHCILTKCCDLLKAKLSWKQFFRLNNCSKQQLSFFHKTFFSTIQKWLVGKQLPSWGSNDQITSPRVLNSLHRTHSTKTIFFAYVGNNIAVAINNLEKNTFYGA